MRGRYSPGRLPLFFIFFFVRSSRWYRCPCEEQHHPLSLLRGILCIRGHYQVHAAASARQPVMGSWQAEEEKGNTKELLFVIATEQNHLLHAY